MFLSFTPFGGPAYAVLFIPQTAVRGPTDFIGGEKEEGEVLQKIKKVAGDDCKQVMGVTKVPSKML